MMLEIISIHILIDHENLFKNVVTPLRKEGHVVDFYLKTYDTDREEDIRKFTIQFRPEFIPIQHTF